ncbi:MAG: Flp pilus assembly complex ATPase component TadA [Clostridiales bacterium]|nr:Flp pilus assembly complex ATPase component TadA [Clostridiales bacterium]
MAIIQKKRLGQILVDSGKITSAQLQEVLAIQKQQGKKLGEILLEKGLVTELDIVHAVEEQTGVKAIDLNNVQCDKKVLKIVPQRLCNKYTLAPFGFSEGKIKVALADPLNIFAIDDISISTGLEVIPFISLKKDINKFIEVNYSTEQVNNAAEELIKESKESKSLEVDDDTFDDIKNAPVVKMIDRLFKNAIDMRASDIHIEPYENEIRIRYRIDGKLQLANKLGKESLGPLVTRIKILSGMNIAERRVPQDGRIITKIGDSEVDLRVSVLPIVSGEKVVIRILSRDNYRFGKERMGISNENLVKLNNIVSSPYGIVLVTGPTGSGKSTTLYSILSDLNSDYSNLITVEDPVEYTLEGINQVNVNTKAGMTFAGALRSILRQDPDIIMIGEIRDNETAEIAIRAAITGHLVLSTLHTNDAPSSITRLVDMGVEPFLVSTSVAGIIAQRLVRRVCTHCREEYEATEYEKRILNVDINKPLKLYRGTGCGYCNDTGYFGRIGVYEVMEINREIRDAINNTRDPNVIKDLALKNGMKTLKDECSKLVMQGITTMNELATITLIKEEIGGDS